MSALFSRIKASRNRAFLFALAVLASPTLFAGQRDLESKRINLTFENSSDGRTFDVPLVAIQQGTDVTLQFPLFNFEMLGSGGALASVNQLPHKYRPIIDQTFLCSNNDAYIQAFNAFGSYPTLLDSFELQIAQSGEVALNYYGGDIEEGGHTFNSQSVGYEVAKTSFDPVSIIFTHDFTLELMDFGFFPLPDTDFNLTVSVELKGSLVTLHIPSITFATINAQSPLNFYATLIVPGGYIGTLSDFLPKHLRPEQTQTVYDASSGLNISVDTYGQFTVSSPADVTAVIPVGTYTTAPLDITYHLPHKHEMKIENFIIEEEFATGFTDFDQFVAGIRDSSVNDFYQGIAAFAFKGNFDQPDQTNNAMDVYVAVGHTKNGKLDVAEPIRLTQSPAGTTFGDVAVAINRVNPNNIVFSTGQLTPTETLDVFVSQDCGLTWSGSINIDPSITSWADNRGVIADKYGNFWYAASYGSRELLNFNLLFYLSSDGGYTWTKVFETTDGTGYVTGFYDYPVIAVGEDGNGNYGLWFVSDYFTDETYNLIPRLGFIPTTTLGEFGSGSYIKLPEFINEISAANLCLKKDGKVFLNNVVGRTIIGDNFYGNTLNIKHPGPLEQELVSDAKTILNNYQNLLPTASYPAYGYSYYITTVNNTFYDEENGALIVIYCERPDINSQDYYLYLTASFDEGATWSRKIQISDTPKNNRGFSSVAYDPQHGITIGWYDCRNSPTSTGIQYFGSYISRSELNCMLRSLKRNG